VASDRILIVSPGGAERGSTFFAPRQYCDLATSLQLYRPEGRQATKRLLDGAGRALSQRGQVADVDLYTPCAVCHPLELRAHEVGERIIGQSSHLASRPRALTARSAALLFHPPQRYLDQPAEALAGDFSAPDAIADRALAQACLGGRLGDRKQCLHLASPVIAGRSAHDHSH
jgi:hypothetical protein